MAHDVFLTYSKKDQTTADAACAALERSGIRVWMAPRDVVPGADWPASIIGAINRSRAMVLIFSTPRQQLPAGQARSGARSQQGDPGHPVPHRGRPPQ